ncbi:hypothetical protein ACHAW6_008668 [Cyclotella cf. meneghiniana]
MSGHDLHSKELNNEYKLNWKPIFSRMMDTLGLTIPHNQSEIDVDFVQTSYTISTGYLKECYSFIFKTGNGFWSKVLRHGSEGNIARLPTVNACNQLHACNHSFAVVSIASRKKANHGKKKRDWIWA